MHRSDKRQQAIADTLDKLARDELKRPGTRKAGRPTTNTKGHATGTEAPEGILKVITEGPGTPSTCGYSERAWQGSNLRPTA